jgi:GTP pyrophosphokinase
MSHDALVVLANELRFADVSALYAAVGDGRYSAHSMVEKLVHALGGDAGNEEDLAEVTRPGVTKRGGRAQGSADAAVRVQGIDDMWVKLAKCCTPVPGDEIVGFVTRGSGVSVHRADCRNVEVLSDSPERIVEVEWRDHVGGAYLVQVQVEALDRHRLLSDVTKTLSESHVNILSAEVTTTKDRVAINRFVFEMAEPSHLEAVLNSMRRVDGVIDAYRITGAGSRHT